MITISSRDLHEVDAARSLRCVPQKSDRFLGIVICVSSSRTFGV